MSSRNFKDRIAKILADAIIAGGRYSLRVAKGLSRHTAGQIGKQGARSLFGSHYKNLSDLEKNLVDECGEISGRIVANRIQDGVMYFTTSDFENEAESFQQEMISIIIARGRSKMYDNISEIFVDKPPRQNNELIIEYDIIKQIILAGIAEILEARQRDYS